MEKVVRNCTLSFWMTTNPQTFDIRQDLPGKIVNAKLQHWVVSASYAPVTIDFGDAIHMEDHYNQGLQPGVPLCYGNSYIGDYAAPLRFKSDKLPPHLQISIYLPIATGTGVRKLFPAASFQSTVLGGVNYQGALIHITFQLIPE